MQKTEQQDRVLIISNNVLSETRSNGKTVLSYVDCLPKSMVKQLYFSAEKPSIAGYEYFQLSDKDVLRGIVSRKKRGRVVRATETIETLTAQKPAIQNRTDFFRQVREWIWWKKWKSPQLLQWLDEYKPTAVFFVGGDCCFAYEICRFIVKRYNARLSLYITDDYVMPRKKKSIIGAHRRKAIAKQIRKTLALSSAFFTVSNPMKTTYREVFGYDSDLIVNLTESLKDDGVQKEENAPITLSYIGSIYYGRGGVLAQIAETIRKYNLQTDGKKALLKVFTVQQPSQEESAKIFLDGASEYGGGLSREGVKNQLNATDILVFVESFEESEIEKTKFSLSTKVSEYMSVGKPIFAVGPQQVGSMEYLQDVALCVNAPTDIQENLERLLQSNALQEEYATKAYDKYVKNHNKTTIQKDFIAKIFGKEM